MEIVDRWTNELGGISTMYRDPNNFSDLDKLFAEAQARIDAERYAHIAQQHEIQSNCKYIWITVCPNEKIVSLPMFVAKMTKMMSKKWITNYLYVYEQRGENLAELGKGFHFHLILEKPKNKAYTHILRELANSVDAVTDSSNPQWYNVRAISEEEKDRKITYTTGRKADQSKWLKQDMDIIWRPTVGILPYYNVGII